MFDKDFYPTPEPVIKMMLRPYWGSQDVWWGFEKGIEQGYLLPGKRILEPSAGKGDIVDFISKNNLNKHRIFAVEKNQELSLILKGKGCRIIGEDFLQLETDRSFDMIVMNPPFSNGDKHLLKAWNLLSHGDLVCLLNEQTLLNWTDSWSRKLVRKLIEDHGHVEFIGNVFTDAERETNVNCAIVRLTKPMTEAQSGVDFEEKTKEDKSTPNTDGKPNNDVAKADLVKALVDQYEAAKVAWRELKIAESNFNKYAFSRTYTSSNDKKFIDMNWEEFLDENRKCAWNKVFIETKFKNVMTSDVKADFEKFKEEQDVMDFTLENVENLFRTLFLNRGMILEKCLLKVFDIMCSYDKKNKHHMEGWKTNDSYKVNRKVINPYCISFDESYYKKWGEKFSVNDSSRDKLDDIDRVMCMLSGKKFDTVFSIERALTARFQLIGEIKPGDKLDNVCESEFFKLKFWRKGTLHFEFKDEKLWQEFNIRAAKGKNWLPDSDWEDFKASPTYQEASTMLQLEEAN